MIIPSKFVGHIAPLLPTYIKRPLQKALRKVGILIAPTLPPCDVGYLVTEDNFDEAAYRTANPDVAQAVVQGHFASGRAHFQSAGYKEKRCIRASSGIDSLRAEKLKRLEPFIRQDLSYSKRGLKYDFLSEKLRKETGISETDNVSSNSYDGYALELLARYRDGLILDCGAGRRQRYYQNVINYEVVNYDTTDVLGVGEELPFKDHSFDAVISIAVLEHVRDPFRCAKELVRVLKPGGQLICCVPFLQPLHGYPHHYYNMSAQGLRALFERSLVIDDHLVIDSIGPIWSLTWIVQSWAAGLPEQERQKFLSMPLQTLMAPPAELMEAPWVKKLPREQRFELASATMLFAHKA